MWCSSLYTEPGLTDCCDTGTFWQHDICELTMTFWHWTLMAILLLGFTKNCNLSTLKCLHEFSVSNLIPNVASSSGNCWYCCWKAFCTPKNPEWATGYLCSYLELLPWIRRECRISFLQVKNCQNTKLRIQVHIAQQGQLDESDMIFSNKTYTCVIHTIIETALHSLKHKPHDLLLSVEGVHIDFKLGARKTR